MAFLIDCFVRKAVIWQKSSDYCFEPEAVDRFTWLRDKIAGSRPSLQEQKRTGAISPNRLF